MKKLLYAIPLLLLAGCHDCSEHEQGEPMPEPVYMSYEDLRSSVKMQESKPIGKRGKIYLFGTLLLINEPNKGVHFIDNSDPTHPKATAFLNVPGNVDMAIRDGVLYLDSFIDLIAVDLTDPAFPVTKRVKDIFRYDPYQAVEENVYFNYDQTKGVVVGYE